MSEPIVKSVNSSNLSTLTYYPDEQILLVEFLSGGLYEYHGVEREIFDTIIEERFTNQKGEPSCGASFIKLVKNNPKYKFRKVSQD